MQQPNFMEQCLPCRQQTALYYKFLLNRSDALWGETPLLEEQGSITRQLVAPTPPSWPFANI
jgi:hypothetical protein